METLSVFVNGECWASGLTETEAADFAAGLRLEGRKRVLVVPDAYLE